MGAVEEAADRLRVAHETRTPCAPVRDLIAPGDVDTAYAVQSLNTSLAVAAGRRVSGWKIGLTNPVVQRQLGVDQPDFGVLFADTEWFDDLPIDASTIVGLKGERRSVDFGFS